MLSLKNILPVTTVKRDLMKLLTKLQGAASHVIITKEGKAAGVLMSAEEYDGLIETLDILSNKELVGSLNKSRKDFTKGKTYTHEQVFKE